MKTKALLRRERQNTSQELYHERRNVSTDKLRSNDYAIESKSNIQRLHHQRQKLSPGVITKTKVQLSSGDNVSENPELKML